MKVRSHSLSPSVVRGIAIICAAVSVASAQTARAAGVVGTGTAASCTDAAMNVALAGGGLVTFNCGPAPVTIDISPGTGGTGTKTITTDTSIDGGGLITLSGGDTVRVFNVNYGVSLTLQNLTITHGKAGDGVGGGIYNNGALTVTNTTFSNNSAGEGGGIGSGGTLTVTNSTFSGNTAFFKNSAGFGGGICNSGGTLTVISSTFSGNRAFSDNSADDGYGGGINNNWGSLTVSKSTFSDNSAGWGGGGINNNYGFLSITNSTFSGNSAYGGGGIFNAGGTLTVTNTTFSDNNPGWGGGIYTFGGTLTVTNSTFSDNSATCCGGGGIANDNGTLSISNSTFSGNSAGWGGGIYNNDSGQLTVISSTVSGNSAGEGGDGIYNFGTLTLTNTIVANSLSGDDCGGDPITDGGHNLDDGTSCGFSTATGSLSGTNPQLDPAGLNNNGGPTQTIALLASSPAINAGGQTVCAAPSVNNLDQRGFVRPGTGHTSCSIGAYEADSPGPPPPPGLVVTVEDTAGSAVPGADVVVIESDGTRFAAVSGSDGVAMLAGLPDGAYSIYAWAPGYLPEVVQATQTQGSGSATVALRSGALGTTGISSRRLTLEEIVANGIDPTDPNNKNVFQFEVHLCFTETGVCDDPGGGDTITGIIAGGDGGGAHFIVPPGGGCTPEACTLFSGDGGSVAVGFPEVVNGTLPGGQPSSQPSIFWLITPMKGSWLKEFFSIRTMVTNLASTPFTFTDGSTTLALPGGLSLAPTSASQALTVPMADIPGQSSGRAAWVVRGDVAGEYQLSATYTGVLFPFEQTVQFTAHTLNPLKVWGGDAFEMIIDADAQAYRTYPYRVRVGLHNVTDTDPAQATDVYNVAVEALLDEGKLNFIWQPRQQRLFETAVIHPGDTFWTDDVIFVPSITGTLDVAASFVAKAAGNVDVVSHIVSHTPIQDPSTAPTFEITGPGQLTWEAVPGAERYQIFQTPAAAGADPFPTQDFPTSPIAETTDTSASVTGGAGDPVWYAVSAVIGGRNVMFHPIIEAQTQPAPTQTAISTPTDTPTNTPTNTPMNTVTVTPARTPSPVPTRTPVPKSKCDAGKIQCVATKQACLLAVHSKAERKGEPVAAGALEKCRDKFDGHFRGFAKSCIGKLKKKEDDQNPETLCAVATDDTASLESKVDTFVEDVVSEISPTSLPTPAPQNGCDAAKKICVSNRTSCLLNAYLTAVKQGLSEADATAVAKCSDKFSGTLAAPESGCIARLEAKQRPDKPKTLCSVPHDDVAALEAKVDAFVTDVVREIRNAP